MLIEARNVNTGGAWVLLNELMRRADMQGVSLHVRNRRLHKNSNDSIAKSEQIIYFGNLPPFLPKRNSLLYIHNAYLVMPLWDITFGILLGRISAKYFFLAIYLRLFHKNCQVIAVQTALMKKATMQWASVNVVQLPFFQSNFNQSMERIEKTTDICAIGLPSRHKNYMPLLEALERLLKNSINVSVEMTVPDSPKNEALLKKINQLNDAYPNTVINHQNPDRGSVASIYQRSKALYFPSTMESLGLPLVEAAQSGLCVFAPDLPYVRDVINNHIAINPVDSAAIAYRLSTWLSEAEPCRPAALSIRDCGNQLLEGRWHV